MDIKELFKGVAVVIDDNINNHDSNDLILKIVEILEKENIPLLKYEYIPDESIIEHWNNISFILLDWQLFETHVPGHHFDETIHIEQIIYFLNILKNNIFLPIFIFSVEDPNTIIEKLKENELYKDTSNYIFVKRKNDLLSDTNDNKLFEEIENWLKQTPSLYVLKEWEKALNEAKNKLFWDFYNINHKWPSVLQKTFQKDGSDVNYELGNFIFKNIMARTEPIQFDENILKIEDDDLTKEELRKVLEAERFIKNESLPPLYPAAGDIFELFKYEYLNNNKERKKLFINIRPDCDIIRDKENKDNKGNPSNSSDDKYNPHLYCLECEVIKDKDIKINKGSIIERKDSSIIPFILDGKIIEINFNKLYIFNWKQKLYTKDNKETRIFKDTRVGRILPPYITAIQQKYSFYLQRQGLPAIPEKAIK